LDVINKDEAEAEFTLQQEFDLFDTNEPDEAKSTLQEELAELQQELVTRDIDERHEAQSTQRQELDLFDADEPHEAQSVLQLQQVGQQPVMPPEVMCESEPSSDQPADVYGLLSMLENFCLPDDPVISIPKGALIFIINSGINVYL